MNTQSGEFKIFKYKRTFYYQSTIFYFVIFILYLIIRGEFVEDSFTLITKDPIIYFLGAIVIVTLLSLFYSLFKNVTLKIDQSGISYLTRFGIKVIKKERIAFIKLFSEKNNGKQRVFRLIRIKLKDRKKVLMLRPNEFENENELIISIKKLKEELEG